MVVITRRDDEEVDEAAKKLQGISPPLSKIKNNREALRINNLHGHLLFTIEQFTSINKELIFISSDRVTANFLIFNKLRDYWSLSVCV